MIEHPEGFVAAKGLIVAGWLIAFFVLERVRPAAKRDRFERVVPGSRLWQCIGDPARLMRNGCLWLINAAGGPLIIVPVTVWASNQTIGLRPHGLAGWSGLVFDLLLLDFWIYWWHRANHEVPLLWRFHSVHHLDQFLDSTSAGRFHVGEVVLSALARVVPIVLFEIPLATVFAFESVVLAAAIFHHSNLSLPSWLEQSLSRFIITPSIHWVHHHAVRGDTDSNYGTILSIWDPLVGTRSATRRTPDLAIGVENDSEEHLISLLSRPFRRRRY